jgi:hypothetical protein
MRTAFEFCLPTAAKAVPSGPDWIHEIKYDGYRLRVEPVRLFTRNGHDWPKRFPWIVEAALKNREQQFVIDGEAVVLGVDGVSDFNALHSRRHDNEVQLYAFDVLALGGEDLRQLPLSLRARRDRHRAVRRRLPPGPRGPGLETARPTLKRRPVEGLDQGQEPDTPGDGPRVLKRTIARGPRRAQRRHGIASINERGRQLRRPLNSGYCRSVQVHQPISASAYNDDGWDSPE